MSGLAFLDTETTGLDPTRHEVWEVALILHDPADTEAEDRRYLWQLPVDAGRADPMGLQIGRFYERRWGPGDSDEWGDLTRSTVTAAVAGTDPDHHVLVPESAMGEWAERFARLTWGRHLVGAVVSFDARVLDPLLRRHGACPGWHYHLVDVEAMAAGWLGHALAGRYDPDEQTVFRPPWDSEELSQAVGVLPGDFAKHTAMGDAEWAQALYQAVTGR